jgi:transcriptional regulator with XRE-family HTH domain
MIDKTIFEENFPARLAQLRNSKGISARKFSLDIGQGQAYINNIENGKALPSMRGFFYICEYLDISPKDFFDLDTAFPEELNAITADLNSLSPELLSHFAAIVAALAR